MGEGLRGALLGDRDRLLDTGDGGLLGSLPRGVVMGCVTRWEAVAGEGRVLVAWGFLGGVAFRGGEGERGTRAGAEEGRVRGLVGVANRFVLWRVHSSVSVRSRPSALTM